MCERRSPMRAKLLLILFAGAAFGAGLWGFRYVSQGTLTVPTPASAGTLSDIAFPDVTGKMRSLSEWSGKILIVNFWATWCPPCKEEMPEFDRLQQEFGSRGIQFLGVALEDGDAVRAYLQHKPVGYPILIGEAGGTEWAETLGNTLQVLPFTVIFDGAGRVVQTKAGPYKRSELTELFGRLLGPN